MDATCKHASVSLSDGATLQVKLLGANSTAKPLLIALHGAQGVSDHREPLQSFSFLSSRFRLLVYDARGSGRSDDKGPFTHQRWAADVDELREWAGADMCIVAGGSYGGMVALEYALVYPQRVSALLLRDTWANGVLGVLRCLKSILTDARIQPDADRQVRVWSGNIRDNEDLAAAFIEILPIYTPEGSGRPNAPAAPDADKHTEADELILHYKTHNFCFTHNQPRFDLRNRLEQIKAPTLVVCGRHDPITPVMFSEEIAESVPGAQLTIFENSGHSPPSDEPDAFRDRVWQFLDQISA
ncbi:Prolyl aminopeptidase [Purpureocillium takamizusanense]|uniref:Prolyl aminopeptidase n=1 Tax=Purpureocillium takamizusanense TaxID=2060973 RepID=A0A9Q8QS39_9HYPO|nr:Prolyl aminopeptidase [Purpureocillium takamizusanense]UNI24387.1 Prolyl aminopeptidase [Purpureocillium takamizusanense]